MTAKKKPVLEPSELAARVLPHDLATERAVLGSILINSALLATVQSLIVAEDFFRVAHQAIFSSMLRVADERKREVDPLTLLDDLRTQGWEQEVGGPAYIASLTDGVPRTSNIAHYAAIVKDLSRRRALIKTANEILVDAYDGEKTPEQVVIDADKQILSLQRGGHGRMVDLRESFGSFVEDFERRVNNKGQLFGLDTGFKSINELTSGWQPGDMVVIAARPSMGKTVFILNTAEAAAALDKHVAIFSLEMRRRQLEYRRLAHLAQVDLTRLTQGWVNDFDYERISPATGLIGSRPLFVDDSAGQTVVDIRATCRRLKSEGQLDLVIVDYVQLVSGSLGRKGATRGEELADISRRLKILADEVSCPVLVCSQLNRQGETRSDKRPQLSDLRETGALEQDADIVGFLHRAHHRESGPTSFILEKQRNGPTGTVTLSINRPMQTFEDVGPEADIPQAAQEPLPDIGQRPLPPKRRSRRPVPW